MYNKTMQALGEKRSVIRDLFEYGKQLAEKVGSENVFDFTIGNPSVPTPQAVALSAQKHLNSPLVHGYTSAQGLPDVREKIAKYNNEIYGTHLSGERIYLTCGASAGLAISLLSVICPEQDEVVLLTPFFPEYTVFVANAKGRCVIVPMDEKNFQIDFEALKRALTPKTAAIVVNTPNNPSGIVYSAKTLKMLAKTLREAEEKFGTTIVLISDEPYREIVFEGKFESPITYYDDSVLCYSYSKTLSLAGERIGYLAVADTLKNADGFYNAVLGAGRSLGYVCAPSLFQYIVGDCYAEKSNILPYRENRDILVKKLSALGFEVVNPQGAFYLLLKTPTADALEFANTAKVFGILTVPTDTFGLAGYVRIATCVSTQMVMRSLPVWEKLAHKLFD